MASKEMKPRRRRKDIRGKVRGSVRLASAGLAIAAVTQEMRRPKAERTWHGRVAMIPYDFRAPTPRRVYRRLWAPDDPRVLVPRAFGVGWNLNFASIVAAIKRSRVTSSGTPSRD